MTRSTDSPFFQNIRFDGKLKRFQEIETDPEFDVQSILYRKVIQDTS